MAVTVYGYAAAAPVREPASPDGEPSPLGG